MEHKDENYIDTIGSKKLKWIGVDLDGTLAEFIWPDPGIGPIKLGAKEAMQKLIDNGFKVIVYTARPWSHYEAIEKWCIDNGLVVRRILCGKPLFRWMIDDKNCEFKGDWAQTINNILADDKKLYKVQDIPEKV